MLNYIYRLLKAKKREQKGDALKPRGIHHTYAPKEYFTAFSDNDLHKIYSPKIIKF